MRKKAQRVLEENGFAWAVAEHRLHLRQSDETTVDFKRRVAETFNLHVFIDDDPENIQANSVDQGLSRWHYFVRS